MCPSACASSSRACAPRCVRPRDAPARAPPASCLLHASSGQPAAAPARAAMRCPFARTPSRTPPFFIPHTPTPTPDPQLYTIDASAVAKAVGLGRRTNMVMQAAFFALSGVMEMDQVPPPVRPATSLDMYLCPPPFPDTPPPRPSPTPARLPARPPAPRPSRC
jgi:hypothetical protein